MDPKDLSAISGKRLLSGGIPIDVYEDREATFKAMADLMCDAIAENNKAGKETLFIVPVGPTGQYPYFTKRVNKERISLKKTTFVNMDEYMRDRRNMVSAKSPISFRRQMEEAVYRKIRKELLMPPSQRIFPTPGNAADVAALLEERGGADICFGGIGLTGHIAFNEPLGPDSKMTEIGFRESSVRVVRIAEATRVINSLDAYGGDYGRMPEYAITIGMKEILSSKKIRLYCFRDWHRYAVRRASFGAVGSSFPASLLQKHPDARIGIPKELS